LYKFTNISEACTASIIRAMSKLGIRNRLETKEQVSQGRATAEPMEEEVRRRQRAGSQQEKRGHVTAWPMGKG
jgi:hypothetical protein